MYSPQSHTYTQCVAKIAAKTVPKIEKFPEDADEGYTGAEASFRVRREKREEEEEEEEEAEDGKETRKHHHGPRSFMSPSDPALRLSRLAKAKSGLAVLARLPDGLLRLGSDGAESIDLFEFVFVFFLDYLAACAAGCAGAAADAGGRLSGSARGAGAVVGAYGQHRAAERGFLALREDEAGRLGEVGGFVVVRAGADEADIGGEGGDCRRGW